MVWLGLAWSGAQEDQNGELELVGSWISATNYLRVENTSEVGDHESGL